MNELYNKIYSFSRFLTYLPQSHHLLCSPTILLYISESTLHFPHWWLDCSRVSLNPDIFLLFYHPYASWKLPHVSKLTFHPLSSKSSDTTLCPYSCGKLVLLSALWSISIENSTSQILSWIGVCICLLFYIIKFRVVEAFCFISVSSVRLARSTMVSPVEL